MKITVRESFELGIWEKVADAKGINVWAVNEGLIDDDEELTITLEQLKKWINL